MKTSLDYDIVPDPNKFYTDLYDLKIGDLFCEDTYPEVYRVERVITYKEYENPVVIGIEINSKEEVEFYYAPDFSHYGPRVIKLKEKDN